MKKTFWLLGLIVFVGGCCVAGFVMLIYPLMMLSKCEVFNFAWVITFLFKWLLLIIVSSMISSTGLIMAKIAQILD